MRQTIAEDVALISRISAVPAMLQVISETTGMGFAAVARVTDTSWTACAVLDKLNFGLAPGGELELTTTICHEIQSSHLHEPVIIDHVSEDEHYRTHHTPRIYKFESYIAVPVFLSDGSFFGTICALDPKPAQLKSTAIEALMTSFARLLAIQIEAEEKLEQVRADLRAEREVAEWREQFIAVLGHDLRNPLFAITASAELLLRRSLDEKSERIAGHILTSGRRASQLVDDVLDFARGRLGHGIPLSLHECGDLGAALSHVVSEVQRVHPARSIRSSIGGLDSIRCDRERLAQLLSNLVANAISHGDNDGVVEVAARVESGHFLMAVTNQGVPIPEDVLPHLFQPYSRPGAEEPQAGLGLGLYISSQIALAHGGMLTVHSSHEDGTTFTFRMPLS
ncbi:GAF domain-containing sensor histidine kinase [Pseudomonas folii]|uniref:histidine kinase n=1 Tax=Pseudomonas folii TaxID=2762593 RepID=A0ABR7B1R3_9PSED|nr:GAF domain-containing sensor histidine kinase [Pseudomonas folii]MBC3951121.1 GAF domain-containing sensor histidine kinase [Pseudomonas folii]